jgi:hypothetical protein
MVRRADARRDDAVWNVEKYAYRGRIPRIFLKETEEEIFRRKKRSGTLVETMDRGVDRKFLKTGPEGCIFHRCKRFPTLFTPASPV